MRLPPFVQPSSAIEHLSLPSGWIHLVRGAVRTRAVSGSMFIGVVGISPPLALQLEDFVSASDCLSKSFIVHGSRLPLITASVRPPVRHRGGLFLSGPRNLPHCTPIVNLSAVQPCPARQLVSRLHLITAPCFIPLTQCRQTSPYTQSVHLIGSWDNFSKHYTMEHDTKRARGQWRGCYAFTDIICDGDGANGSKRTGGLKMGATYYYYVCLRCIRN